MAQERSASPPTSSMDTELGRLVVEQKLATPEEVEQARKLQEQAGRPELHGSLAEVLVREGVVTETQIQRAKKTLEDARGQQIPGYVILSRIGAGAMATVFKARQLSLDRIVAIKVLPKKLSENKEYVDLFYKEGRAAARLNHANIVQAFDVGEAGGYHYFVMEYVEGHTVYDELAGGKPLSEQRALNIIIQVGRALEHAHARGLIHRDVKPKNIMIATDGAVKLADMGLARQTADKEAVEAEAGRAFGTPFYISPEQIRGAKNLDFRTDIYSLGATLYHMVTGCLPFEGETPVEVMQKHLKQALVPPDHLNVSLSAGIGEVVEVMMAKDPNRRYASTSDVLLDMEAIAAGEAPLQARKQIDAGVLSGLADGTGPEEPAEHAAVAAPGNLLILVIILAGALILSILLNVVQFLTQASR